jgi:hypothetical protein
MVTMSGFVDETAQVVEAADVEDEQEPEEPALSLTLVMEDEPAPRLELHKFAPDYPEGYFIRAKAPASEAAITGEARRITIEDFAPQNRAARRKGRKVVASDGQQAMVVQLDEDKLFLAKCFHQITDFSLVAAKGQHLRFDNAKGGRNQDNEAVYRAFMKPKNKDLRWLVEAYLDWVAGRDEAGDLDEQFEALGNG